MKPEWWCTVLVKTGDRSRASMAGFLDMMRYDQARVRKWDYTAPDQSFTVHLATPARPTLERWYTFGLFPQNVEQRNG